MLRLPARCVPFTPVHQHAFSPGGGYYSVYTHFSKIFQNQIWLLGAIGGKKKSLFLLRNAHQIKPFLFTEGSCSSGRQRGGGGVGTN